MKKSITIISIIIGVGILGFVVYSFLTSSKVPQAFIDKHNETVALGKEAAQISDLNNLPEWAAFNAQLEAKNYTEAAKSIVFALDKKGEASEKLDTINSKLSELESISAKVTNTEVKTSANNFIAIAKKENTAKITYNDLQIQMIGKLKAMVDILAKNSKTISAADEKTINSLSEEINGLKTSIDTAEAAVNTIQSQYKVAETDFFKLAGLEIGT
jgi:hypothetical protein